MRKAIGGLLMFGILLGIFHKVIRPAGKKGWHGTKKVVKVIV